MVIDMELRKQSEIRETQIPETEQVTGDVQSMTEAKEVFDKIMNMEEPSDGAEEYQAPKGTEISFGSAASTS